MKKTISLFIFLAMNLGLASFSMADSKVISVLCTKNSASTCALRVVNALGKMGCDPIAENIKCETTVNSAAVEVCQIEALKCYEPRATLFIATECSGGDKKISFRTADSGLSLTWWMGFGPYIRNVCKN